ncbi:Prs ADP-ribosylating antitoxin [Gammaproteobacteria bacterium]
MESTVRKTTKASRSGGSAIAPSAAPILGFAGVYLASPLERVETIRRGLPASVVVETGEAMNLSRERLYTLLDLPRATLARKISAKALLSPEMSERLLGLHKLIGQVEVMVRQSGDPEGFGAARWVAEWLSQPSPALGGRQPGELMDTVEGQEIVSGLIARMQSGAYT